jgi:hypothetical protein
MITASTRNNIPAPIDPRAARERSSHRAGTESRRVNAGASAGAKTQIRAMPLTSIDFPFVGENDIGYRACWQMVSIQKFDRT